jgi:hypothetical protein
VVISGLWLMFAHPWLMLALLLLLVIGAAWLLPKLWRGIEGLIGRLSLPRTPGREPLDRLAQQRNKGCGDDR